MTFDLTDLRLVVNVAEQRSFTRGADLSFLSVPAASNRIKNLENRLGVELLCRSSVGVTITPVGRTFLQHARTMLLQAEHLYGDLQTFAKGIRGNIRMYAATTAIMELLPELLSQFLSTRPDVNMNHPGNRGGYLVTVKQVPQRVLQVVDNNVLRLQPAGCRRSTRADAGD